MYWVVIFYLVRLTLMSVGMVSDYKINSDFAKQNDIAGINERLKLCIWTGHFKKALVPLFLGISPK